MFDEVASGYDRTNTVLSLGQDKLWRVATTRAVAPRPGQRILDLAAGTGASSVALARSGAEVVAGDFSPGMIAEGRRRHGHVPNVTFVEADAMAPDQAETVQLARGVQPSMAEPVVDGDVASQHAGVTGPAADHQVLRADVVEQSCNEIG